MNIANADGIALGEPGQARDQVVPSAGAMPYPRRRQVISPNRAPDRFATARVNGQSETDVLNIAAIEPAVQGWHMVHSEDESRAGHDGNSQGLEPGAQAAHVEPREGDHRGSRTQRTAREAQADHNEEHGGE